MVYPSHPTGRNRKCLDASDILGEEVRQEPVECILVLYLGPVTAPSEHMQLHVSQLLQEVQARLQGGDHVVPAVDQEDGMLYGLQRFFGELEGVELLLAGA